MIVQRHKVFLTCEHEVEEVARGRQHYSVCQDVLPINHQDDITEDPLNTGQRSGMHRFCTDYSVLIITKTLQLNIKH